MSNGIKFDANCDMINAEGADYGGPPHHPHQHEDRRGRSHRRPVSAASRSTLPTTSPSTSRAASISSDPRYLGHEPVMQATMAVYRIDTDGIGVTAWSLTPASPTAWRYRRIRNHSTWSATTTAPWNLFRLDEGRGLALKGRMALMGL